MVLSKYRSFQYELKEWNCTKFSITSSLQLNKKSILGEYSSFFSFQVRDTIYTSKELTCIETTCIKTTLLGLRFCWRLIKELKLNIAFICRVILRKDTASICFIWSMESCKSVRSVQSKLTLGSWSASARAVRSTCSPQSVATCLLFELSLNSRMNPYQVGLNISLTGPECGLKMLNTFGINAKKSHLALRLAMSKQLKQLICAPVLNEHYSAFPNWIVA